ncbi:hypothetical protein HHI36_023657 [Cryptolaemus montrouzieri]|uniref:Uncharacterized protein n=1 Tax=Cryptolaemus montrouzieri TaxID=559131 RepID=A0ABD2PHK2_9CUCU
MARDIISSAWIENNIETRQFRYFAIGRSFEDLKFGSAVFLRHQKYGELLTFHVFWRLMTLLCPCQRIFRNLSKASKISEPHATYYAEKASSLVLESHLTMLLYNSLRQCALELYCNLYPHMRKSLKQKKCYPQDILCTEVKTAAPPQGLSDKAFDSKIVTVFKTSYVTFNISSKENCAHHLEERI